MKSYNIHIIEWCQLSRNIEILWYIKATCLYVHLLNVERRKKTIWNSHGKYKLLFFFISHCEIIFKKKLWRWEILIWKFKMKKKRKVFRSDCSLCKMWFSCRSLWIFLSVRELKNALSYSPEFQLNPGHNYV